MQKNFFIVTGGKISTPPDSDDDCIQPDLDVFSQNEARVEPQINHLDLSPPQTNQPQLPQTGRQKVVASVNTVHPPAMLAKLTAGLKKSTIRVVEDVRSHYAVSASEQPDGVLSDELRVGMKRAAADVPRSQFEIYSFASRHSLSEAATDELLQSVSNVSIVVIDDLSCVFDDVRHKQVSFDPNSIIHKTMKTMDRAARLAMLPDYEIFCVDLTEGNVKNYDIL